MGGQDPTAPRPVSTSPSAPECPRTVKSCLLPLEHPHVSLGWVHHARGGLGKKHAVHLWGAQWPQCGALCPLRLGKNPNFPTPGLRGTQEGQLEASSPSESDWSGMVTQPSHVGPC